MESDNQEKTFKESFIENIKETSHWIFAFAPLVASILATIYRTDNHVLEIVFICLAVLFNFTVLILRSQNEKENELYPFYTFVWNRTKPPKKTGQLMFKTRISIVEDEESSNFVERTKKKFLTDPQNILDDNEKRIIEKSQKLDVSLISCSSLKIVTNDEEEKEREIINLKDNLKSDLSESEAVIVVRKENLDKKTWVYEAINEWAIKNSDVPILFVRPDDRSNYPKHEIADKFFWIPDNPKTLPWRLLTRAKKRASIWREQASYNRAMVTNITFLLLMFVYLLGFYIFEKLKKIDALESEKKQITETKDKEIANNLLLAKDKQKVLVKGIKEATETKESYEEIVLKHNDSELNVSYWIRHDGKPFVFVTTEKGNKKYEFENNSSSIIGCAFSAPSKLVQWNAISNTRVFEFTGNKEIKNHDCVMFPRIEEITNIICSSYKPSGTVNDEETVGICIFTGGKKPINIDKNHVFLRKKTEAFYNNFVPYIKDKTITTLAERMQESNSPDF